GCARTRTRDQGNGGPPLEARPALSGLPLRGRLDLPRLTDLHDKAEAGVPELQAAARGAVATVSVLRDAGRADCGFVAVAAVRVPSSSPRGVVTVPRRWPWRRHSSLSSPTPY